LEEIAEKVGSGNTHVGEFGVFVPVLSVEIVGAGAQGIVVEHVEATGEDFTIGLFHGASLEEGEAC
jgi:tryptophan synthase beta subunit